MVGCSPRLVLIINHHHDDCHISLKAVGLTHPATWSVRPTDRPPDDEDDDEDAVFVNIVKHWSMKRHSATHCNI